MWWWRQWTTTVVVADVLLWLLLESFSSPSLEEYSTLEFPVTATTTTMMMPWHNNPQQPHDAGASARNNKKNAPTSSSSDWILRLAEGGRFDGSLLSSSSSYHNPHLQHGRLDRYRRQMYVLYVFAWNPPLFVSVVLLLCVAGH